MIYPSINYCPCPSYKYQVSDGFHSLCKHVLATVIADVTGKKHSIEITDDHFRDLILEAGSEIGKLFTYNSLNTMMKIILFSHKIFLCIRF